MAISVIPGGARSDQATDHAAVTPSDTAALPDGRCKALWLNAAGTVTVKLREGGAALPYTVAAPGWVNVQAWYVMATGTDAAVVTAGINAVY